MTGNGLLLPSGPLRESLSALKNIDVIIINGEKQQANVDHDINTRLKTFLFSFIAIVTTKTVTIKVTNLLIK